jgi:hypothetical protein
MHKCVLLHSIEDMRYKMLSAMKQVPEESSRLEKKSSHFDLSTCLLYNAMTLAPSKAITAMTRVRDQVPLPSKQKKRSVSKHIP